MGHTQKIQAMLRRRMKKVTVSTYRKDKYYPRVTRAFAVILSRSDEVAPVKVLIEMGHLSRKDLDAWRLGKIPFLERVFKGSLSKANRILRIIGFHAHDLNMVPRVVRYHRQGKGQKNVLWFSKSGEKKIEAAYARHFRWNQSAEKKRSIIEGEEVQATSRAMGMACKQGPFR